MIEPYDAGLGAEYLAPRRLLGLKGIPELTALARAAAGGHTEPPLPDSHVRAAPVLGESTALRNRERHRHVFMRSHVMTASPHAQPIEMLDTLQIPEPGRKVRGNLRFSHPLLQEWSWPLTIVRGARGGPTLAITSGVHPTEYPAIEANIRTAAALDPVTLRGTVISLPIVDMPAFLTRSPFVCPIDNKNPNRFFPGDPNGTFTEAMDDAIFRAVMAPADALIDLHGGDMVEALEPFAIYSVSGDDELDRASAAMGRAFGLPYLIANRPKPGGLGGTTVQAAAAAKIPAILPEAGSCGLLTEPETRMMTEGIENVMRHLGMLDGTPRPTTPPTEIAEFTWLFAPAEGMWYPSVTVGQAVAKDQPVGRIRSLFGDELATMAAPHGGTVIFVTTSPAMKNGGILLAIGA
jgi:predicted deacylase